ncbi:MAG: GspH/FimT family pseudopilin [Polaromonas sp.]|nr:GspH/FimT family pseudopilin [Polaromonas sp.]
MIYIRSQARGFTLIEMMITLVIAAVLAMVAVPGLTAYKRNAELTSAINTLLSAVNAARSEAMKRGMKAMVIPADGRSWNKGWIVFVDKNGDQAYSEANDITILTQGPLESYFTIATTGSASLSAPYILFDSSGYSKLTNGGFSALTLSVRRNDLSGSAIYEQTRRLVIAKTGRARTCKPAAANDPACLSNGTQ